MSACFNLDQAFHTDDYLWIYEPRLTAERTLDEISWMLKAGGIMPGMRVLDAACGYGRHLVELARLGVSMSGVDRNPEFIAMARQKTENLSFPVDLQAADLMDYNPSEEKFDAILLMFTTFGYSDDAGNEALLARLSSWLNPGGILLMDLPNRDYRASLGSMHHVEERENGLVIERLSFEGISGRLINDRLIVRDGQIRPMPFSVRLYNPTEITRMAENAGLVLMSMHSGTHGKPFETRAPLMWCRFARF